MLPHYRVARMPVAADFAVNGDRAPWCGIVPLSIGNAMGDPPAALPLVHAKVAYDPEAVYVYFQVRNDPLRAVTLEYQGPVWEDSCVEFFFTPGPDPSSGYFNLEINCVGAALLCFQKARGIQVRKISVEDFQTVQVIPSLSKRRHDNPHALARDWALAYRLPTALLANYAPVTPPVPGAKWRANFYKCGDKTPTPHWMTWAPVSCPYPDFHRPEAFGILEFAG